MRKKHNTQLGFKVPEDYFETSAQEHLAFLNEKKTKEVKKSYRKALIFMGCLGGLLISVWFFKPGATSSTAESFELLTIESLEVQEDEFDEWFDENFILSDV
jgi:hypothetical protein